MRVSWCVECAHISLIEPPRHIKRRGDSHLHNIHAAQSITCRLLFSRGKQAGGMRFRWSSGAVDTLFFCWRLPSRRNTRFFILQQKFVSYYTAEPAAPLGFAVAKWIAHLPPAQWNRPSRVEIPGEHPPKDRIMRPWDPPWSPDLHNPRRLIGVSCELSRRQESSNLTGFLSSIQMQIIGIIHKKERHERFKCMQTSKALKTEELIFKFPQIVGCINACLYLIAIAKMHLKKKLS